MHYISQIRQLDNLNMTWEQSLKDGWLSPANNEETEATDRFASEHIYQDPSNLPDPFGTGSDSPDTMREQIQQMCLPGGWVHWYWMAIWVRLIAPLVNSFWFLLTILLLGWIFICPTNAEINENIFRATIAQPQRASST